MKLIIFTDLDGTLLDEEYSWDKAKPALDLIKKLQIPLVICSSKTRNEIEEYRHPFGVNDPFISENGGAVFIPKDYFPFKFTYDKGDSYFIIELGAPYREIRNRFEMIKGDYDI